MSCCHHRDIPESCYWREYTGVVPPDAIVGGQDRNGQNVYIGQAYHKNVGLIVVQIYDGVKEVVIPIFSKIIKVDKNIKILCGSQESLFWLPAKASDLHVTLLDKHAVTGGHVDGGGLIGIGRISIQGETKIGRILSYQINKAFFYYHNGDKEGINIPSYEILLFQQ